MLPVLRWFDSCCRPAVVLAAALTVGCGGGGTGGVDSGGTGAPAASFASGTITGFGTVIVTDVHFDDLGAVVSDADGRARSRDELRLGMSVDVRGSSIVTDAEGHQASTATSFVINSAIVGPIGANDLAARTLTVLAQTIDVASTTVFDNGLAGGQSALAPGDVVEVHARFNALTGRYAATRVERKTGVATYAVRGIASNLDAGSRTFSIGSLRLSYAGLGAAPAALVNGAFVRVSLGLAPGAGGAWPVVRVANGSPPVDDRPEAKVEGLVTAFTSSARFTVDGTPVDASHAQFPDGTQGLAIGGRVEVEGQTIAGVLVASRVKQVSDSEESAAQFDVRGTITSIDTAAQTFLVRGVVVSYSGSVDFRDGTAADLAVGREVEARGTLSPDGTRVQAARLDFRD